MRIYNSSAHILTIVEFEFYRVCASAVHLQCRVQLCIPIKPISGMIVYD